MAERDGVVLWTLRVLLLMLPVPGLWTIGAAARVTDPLTYHLLAPSPEETRAEGGGQTWLYAQAPQDDRCEFRLTEESRADLSDKLAEPPVEAPAGDSLTDAIEDAGDIVAPVQDGCVTSGLLAASSSA